MDRLINKLQGDMALYELGCINNALHADFSNMVNLSVSNVNTSSVIQGKLFIDNQGTTLLGTMNLIPEDYNQVFLNKAEMFSVHNKYFNEPCEFIANSDDLYYDYLLSWPTYNGGSSYNAYGSYFVERFNTPVTIDPTVTNCRNMFYNCRNFNQPVTIPNGVTDCRMMFMSCSNFNQQIEIPDSVIDCSQMFAGSIYLNSVILLGNNVVNCYAMFRDCTFMRSSYVHIPESAENCAYMYQNCNYLRTGVISLPKKFRTEENYYRGCYGWSANANRLIYWY